MIVELQTRYEQSHYPLSATGMAPRTGCDSAERSQLERILVEYEQATEALIVEFTNLFKLEVVHDAKGNTTEVQSSGD